MSSDADDETACSDAMMNPMSSEARKNIRQSYELLPIG